jgi:hypothetical protein
MWTRIETWLARKWDRKAHSDLAQAYLITFSGPGQQVLAHLMDEVYCTVYAGRDPLELAYHEGRRSVVQEILENIDMAERPDTYRTGLTAPETQEVLTYAG